MNIYLAGSFRYVNEVRALANKIRFYNHDVYCFCDAETDAYKYSLAIRANVASKTYTPKTALNDPMVVTLGFENWGKLAHVDVVIVALPCGKSAHLEAGWAKGQRKRVYLYGKMLEGEWDAMNVMMDNVFDENEFIEMMNVVNELA